VIRYLRIGLAGLLLVLMGAIAGLTITTSGLGGVSAMSPAIATSTAVVAQATQPVSGQVITTSSQAQSAAMDARSAVSEVGPAVVTIVNTQSVVSRRGRTLGTATAVGSGIIIDSRGYIITNNHVIENQQSLEVIFSDGTKAAATVVGADSSLDLAVVKVDSVVPAVATLGDSNSLEAGQPVVAIGTALGDFRNTVTAGIVSGLDRDLDSIGATSISDGTSLHDLVQTDASINEGNSGGPLIDMSGEVIGVNVAVVRSSGMQGDVAEGLGFAIPSNTVKTFAQQYIK